MTRRALGLCVSTAVLTGPQALLAVAAIHPDPWLFSGLLVAVLAAERVRGRLPSDSFKLGKAGLGGGARSVLLEAAVVVLLVRSAAAGPASAGLFVAGVTALHLMRAWITRLVAEVTRLHQQPVETRNIDLSELRVPRTPPTWLMRTIPDGMAALGEVIVLAATAAALANLPGMALAGLVPGLVGSGVALAALPGHVRAARHLGDQRKVMEAVHRQVERLAPEVILYSGGGDAYQVNAWLPTLEKLRPRCMVILRGHDILPALYATSLPVLCMARGDDVLNLPLPHAKVVLYPANTGSNLYMLRRSGLTSVFIGHGDSDKEASANPFSKVYDEVWVAGPAGRDRYAGARVAIDHAAIVEVGRPQLHGIEGAAVRPDGRAGRVRTVLYAPTWEGWGGYQNHTSITTMGPQIIKVLLDRYPELRVIYKPHPKTGSTDDEAAAADAEIVRMIEEANAGRDAGQEGPVRVAGRHLVVTAGSPTLYDCFNEADLLVSDVSAVVTDFLASGKPYVMTNVRGMDADRFRERHPTSRAAYLLTGADQLDEILNALDKEDPDELAGPRRELSGYLLGTGEPGDMTRFADAVAAAIERRRNPDERG